MASICSVNINVTSRLYNANEGYYNSLLLIMPLPLSRFAKCYKLIFNWK